MSERELSDLDAEISECRACPRLVAWREKVAAEKRAAFRDQEYWGRPVPGFGPADARILIVGLAPAAHGGNRTGRIFTGDRSGDVLFQSLHSVGLANQPTSVSIDDGLKLRGVRIAASVRCAPPDNKPTPQERDTCAPWLVREVTLIKPTLRVVVALGAFAWASWFPVFSKVYEESPPRPRPPFGHGALWTSPSGLSFRQQVASDRSAAEPTAPKSTAAPEQSHNLVLLGSYHVSQQNTFTGRLTPAMLDAVFTQAKQIAGLN